MPRTTYRTRSVLWLCAASAVACSDFVPTNGSSTAADGTTGATSGVIAASDSNFAGSLAPPSHDANSIGQVSLAPTASCPAPADANDYFGLPRCCYTKAAFCEDFESDTVNQGPNPNVWTVDKASSDIVVISSDQHARGSQSLHFHVNNSGGQHAMIVNTSAFPFANDSFWGRAFVYWNGTVYTNNHTTYVAAGPSPNTGYEWMRYSSFGSGDLGGNDSDPDNSAGSSTALPAHTWACMEWFYDTPNMQAHYYLNGQLISTLAIDSKHTGTNDLHWQQIEIGWELYSQDGTTPYWDMYFDEIALNGTRIGCAN